MWCSRNWAKGVSKSLEFLNWEFHFWSKFLKESITRDSHLLGINATGLTLSEDPMTMRRSTSFLSYFMARWNCSGRFSPKNTMSGFMMASGSSGGQRGQRGTTCTQQPLLLPCRAPTALPWLTGTASGRDRDRSVLLPHVTVLWMYRQVHFLLLPAATAQGNKAAAGIKRERAGRPIPQAKVQQLCSTPAEHTSHLTGKDFS